MNERQTDGPPEEEPKNPSEKQPEAAGEQPAQSAAEPQPQSAPEPEPPQAAAPAPAEKKGGRVGRLVLWCALAVLVVLAFLDYRTKSAAQQTGDAWREALRQKAIGTDLTESELGKYIEGDPAHETIKKVSKETLEKLDPDIRLLVNSAAVYTWKGIFRDYTVTLYFSLGGDPPVEAVDGPGRTDDPQKEKD